MKTGGGCKLVGEFKNVDIKFISLGQNCFVGMLLRKINLKKCSYPFDWLTSTIEFNIDIINDNFVKFLDRNNYSVSNIKGCYINDENKIKKMDICISHKNYGIRFFPHKNPMEDDEYEYYMRCVSRFNQHLKYLSVYICCTHDPKQNNYYINIFNKINNKLSNCKYIIIIVIKYICTDIKEHIEHVFITKSIIKLTLNIYKNSPFYINAVAGGIRCKNNYILDVLSDYFNNYRFLETNNELDKTIINQKIYNIIKS